MHKKSINFFYQVEVTINNLGTFFVHKIYYTPCIFLCKVWITFYFTTLLLYYIIYSMETKSIKINKVTHKKIKVLAFKKGISIIKLVDLIYKDYVQTIPTSTKISR